MRRGAALRGACLAIVVAALTCPGCWDRRELNQLAIVGVLAIDRVGEELHVTGEIFRAQAGTQSDAVSTVSPSSFGARSGVIIRGRGKSVMWAIRDAAKRAPRRLYGAHIVACIVGEEAAREDLRQILDVWEREMELRMTAYLLVAKGRAETLLTSAVGLIESTVAGQIVGLAGLVRYNGYTMASTVNEVIAGLLSGDRVAVTGVIQLVSSEQAPAPRSPFPGEEGPVQPIRVEAIEIDGLAIIRDCRLEAILPGSPITRCIVASHRKMEGGILDLDARAVSPGSKEGDIVVLKVFRATSRVDVDVRGAPKARLFFDLEADLSSQVCDRTVDAELIRTVQTAAEDAVRREAEDAIAELQGLGLDACGFARALHKKDPKMWASVKEDWPGFFRSMGASVDVRVRVRHMGPGKDPALARTEEGRR